MFEFNTFCIVKWWIRKRSRQKKRTSGVTRHKIIKWSKFALSNIPSVLLWGYLIYWVNPSNEYFSIFHPERWAFLRPTFYPVIEPSCWHNRMTEPFLYFSDISAEFQCICCCCWPQREYRETVHAGHDAGLFSVFPDNTGIDCMRIKRF